MTATIPRDDTAQGRPGTKDLPYRAWLLDFDGTLYRAAPVRLAMAGELLLREWSAIRVLQIFRREHERLRDSDAPHESGPFVSQLERTAQQVGRSVEEVEHLVAKWMFERPLKWLKLFRRRGLLAEIRRYRVAGGRVALVSDYPVSTKFKALGADDLIDLVIANGEPGGPKRLKPWPDGYLLAAAGLGIAPEACLVLGDRPDADGEAARRAGMGYRRIG